VRLSLVARKSPHPRWQRDSDDPLDVIGRQTGYTSEFAFAKAFKREFGVRRAGTAKRSVDARLGDHPVKPRTA
jgi:AraC-like DNA-binding protein